MHKVEAISIESLNSRPLAGQVFDLLPWVTARHDVVA